MKRFGELFRMIETATDVVGEMSALIEILDHLAPRLDTYEQALYLYVYRHTYLAAKGTRIAEGTIYEKLRSLASKGCVELLDVTRRGTRLRLRLPAEIPGVIPAIDDLPVQDIEIADFFTEPRMRTAIFERDGWRCFYCLKHLDSSNGVVEHIVSRPHGNNGYRNLVAACARCNNRKGFQSADAYLRRLFREGFLSDEELTEQLLLLAQTQSGGASPIL